MFIESPPHIKHCVRSPSTKTSKTWPLNSKCFHFNVIEGRGWSKAISKETIIIMCYVFQLWKESFIQAGSEGGFIAFHRKSKS